MKTLLISLAMCILTFSWQVKAGDPDNTSLGTATLSVGDVKTYKQIDLSATDEWMPIYINPVSCITSDRSVATAELSAVGGLSPSTLTGTLSITGKKAGVTEIVCQLSYFWLPIPIEIDQQKFPVVNVSVTVTED